jgi:hypothetical protein
MTEGRAVSIATVLASGVSLHPREAVAIVLELCGHLSCQRPSAGVRSAISASTVTIDQSGAVAVEGGSPGEDEQTVSLAGRLLAEMLDSSNDPTDVVRIPSRLMAAAELAATHGRRGFGSAAQFVSALRRHRPEYGERAAIRGLFLRWQARARGCAPIQQPAPPAPTITEADAQFSVARALLVSAVLLALAGAGAAYFIKGAAGGVPPPIPVLKSTPATPRPQPARELLRGSERVSAGTTPSAVAVRRAPVTPPRELTTAPPDQGLPTR